MDDVAHLKELYEALLEVLREHGVEERYEAISSHLPDFIAAAVRGVPLDTGTIQPALDTLEREKADLERRLNELSPEHPEGLEWVWGNMRKETSPDGKGRNGALKALSLVGVELFGLQDQTLLDHREDHELVHTLYLTLQKLAADPRLGTHFLLSVHDELILECPKEDARGVALWLKTKIGEAMKEI